MKERRTLHVVISHVCGPISVRDLDQCKMLWAEGYSGQILRSTVKVDLAKCRCVDVTRLPARTFSTHRLGSQYEEASSHRNVVLCFQGEFASLMMQEES